MKKRIARSIARLSNKWKRSYVNRGLEHPRTLHLERTILNLATIYGIPRKD